METSPLQTTDGLKNTLNFALDRGDESRLLPKSHFHVTTHLRFPYVSQFLFLKRAIFTISQWRAGRGSATSPPGYRAVATTRNLVTAGSHLATASGPRWRTAPGCTSTGRATAWGSGTWLRRQQVSQGRTNLSWSQRTPTPPATRPRCLGRGGPGSSRTSGEDGEKNIRFPFYFFPEKCQKFSQLGPRRERASVSFLIG